MLQPVREGTGLGCLPASFTINACKSLNAMLKRKVNYKNKLSICRSPQEPHWWVRKRTRKGWLEEESIAIHENFNVFKLKRKRFACHEIKEKAVKEGSTNSGKLFGEWICWFTQILNQRSFPLIPRNSIVGWISLYLQCRLYGVKQRSWYHDCSCSWSWYKEQHGIE